MTGRNFWYENQLLARREDPQGHANSRISFSSKTTCLMESRSFLYHLPSTYWILSKLYMFPTLFPLIIFFPKLASSVWIYFPVGECSVYSTNYSVNLCMEFFSVCSSHHCATYSLCWISINKDVLFEFHRLFKLQSRSSHKYRNEMGHYQNEIG